MNELVHYFGREPAAPSRIAWDPPVAVARRQREIEVSWQRVTAPKRHAALPAVLGVARKALLVWGGVSLAAISGAAVVYAHGGFTPDAVVAAAEIAPAPPSLAPVTKIDAPAVEKARKPVRIVTATAAILATAPRVPAAAPAAPPPVEETAVAARLPRPRPSDHVVAAAVPPRTDEQQVAAAAPPRKQSQPAATASATYRPANLRRPVYIHGRQVFRARYYRYYPPAY